MNARTGGFLDRASDWLFGAYDDTGRKPAELLQEDVITGAKSGDVLQKTPTTTTTKGKNPYDVKITNKPLSFGVWTSAEQSKADADVIRQQRLADATSGSQSDILQKAKVLSVLQGLQPQQERIDFSPLKRMIDRQQEQHNISIGLRTPQVGVDDPSDRPLSPEELQQLKTRSAIDQLSATLGIARFGEDVTKGAVDSSLANRTLQETVQNNLRNAKIKQENMRVQKDIAYAKNTAKSMGVDLNNDESLQYYTKWMEDRETDENLTYPDFLAKVNTGKFELSRADRQHRLELKTQQKLKELKQQQ